MSTIAPLLGAVVLTAIVGSAVQGGIHVSSKKLKPTFKQFNLLAGIKRLLGAQSWWQGGKSLLKTIVIGAVLTSVVQGIAPMLLASGGMSLSQVLGLAGNGVGSLMRTAVMAGIVLAVVDVVFVSKQNRKKTKMTLKEVKDEHKSSEGDPLLKGAIRSKQMAMSRNRMMAAIADADVVLVNPTHVAVALKYEPGTGAPRVVAKGAGHVAARIRKQANDEAGPARRGRPARPGAARRLRARPGDPGAPVHAGRQGARVRHAAAPPRLRAGHAPRPGRPARRAA